MTLFENHILGLLYRLIVFILIESCLEASVEAEAGIL
jgi:hypothetical protein